MLESEAQQALETQLLEHEWKILQLQIRLATMAKLMVSLLDDVLRNRDLPLQQRYLLSDIRKVLRRDTTTEERNHG